MGKQREKFFAIHAAEALRQAGKHLAPLLDAIAFVSGKELIAAIAGKRNGDVLPGKTRNEICRQHRRVAKRLFQRSRQLLHRPHNVGLKHQFVMFGTKLLGHDAGIFGLIEVGLSETNGKSLDRRGTGPRHERDYRGGVRPPA